MCRRDVEGDDSDEHRCVQLAHSPRGTQLASLPQRHQSSHFSRESLFVKCVRWSTTPKLLPPGVALAKCEIEHFSNIAVHIATLGSWRVVSNFRKVKEKEIVVLIQEFFLAKMFVGSLEKRFYHSLATVKDL